MSLNVSVKGHRIHTNFTLTTDVQALVAANVNRKSVIFQNQGNVTVYIGPQGVGVSGANRGYALGPGNAFTDDASAEEWWGLAESGTAILHIIDVR